MSKPIAVVTGASSGIGEATARRLSDAGYGLVLGARRIEKLRQIASEVDGEAIELDVTDQESVSAFARHIHSASVLVNCAGGALGMDRISESNDEKWVKMFETNVLGTVRMIRALLPCLQASPPSHIVNMGSIAGTETYVGGSGYCAAKHAIRAVTQTLRLELLGKPIRITEIAPGMVETEFSLVRFAGDVELAKRPYIGIKPLSADNIAEIVAWVVAQPEHVNIDYVVVRPVAQATATTVHRVP